MSYVVKSDWFHQPGSLAHALNTVPPGYNDPFELTHIYLEDARTALIDHYDATLSVVSYFIQPPPLTLAVVKAQMQQALPGDRFTVRGKKAGTKGEPDGLFVQMWIDVKNP
jgi:hypothetical protein